MYFRQGTGSLIMNQYPGITYHDVKSIVNHLGEEVCKIMPDFQTLTGCDCTALLFGRFKYSIFKSMQKHSNAERLLLSLNTESVDVPDVIDFIITLSLAKSKIRTQCMGILRVNSARALAFM